MIVEQTIWKLEPEKITLFFISQTGHGKPMINAFKDVSPNGAAKLTAKIQEDNSMFRVFSAWREYYVFVIYKKHYNTRDTAAAIQEAYQKVREIYPDQTIKTTYHNKAILAALKDEENIEFYTNLSGPVIK